MIISNSLRTPDGTTITSYHRHDYVVHLDANGKRYMVDGGTDYLRRSANGDEVDLSVEVDDNDFDTLRSLVTWGTYGPDGNQPLKRVTIANLDTDHIYKILDIPTLSPTYQVLLTQELAHREKSNF